MEGRTARRKAGAGVIDDLASRIGEFEFFQAVRTLQRRVDDERRAAGGSPTAPLGSGHRAEAEAVRLRSHPTLRFLASECVSLSIIESKSRGQAGERRRRAELTVSFMGLLGTVGALPEPYTAIVLERLRSKDPVLRDFLDVFNHRALSLHYRAWERNRFVVDYGRYLGEQGKADRPKLPKFIATLYSLVGLRSSWSRAARPLLDPVVWLAFAGHFSRSPRNAAALEAMLGEYFELPVVIEQFVPRRIPLDDTELLGMTRFDEAGRRLGVDTTIGDSVIDIQSSFRIRLGPLGLAVWSRLLPKSQAEAGSASDLLAAIVQFVRAYVGVEFDFEVLPVLKADEIPACCLSAEDYEIGQLGRTAWLVTRKPDEDFADASFPARDLSG